MSFCFILLPTVAPAATIRTCVSQVLVRALMVFAVQSFWPLS